jgi:hypothetical protein
MINEDYEKSRELIKTSTSFKVKDILGAINLIQEAINLCPEKILSDYFKLANYFHLASRKDYAYGILNKLILDLNVKEIGMYNMHKTLVYDKICVLNYKDKDFKLYLMNYSFCIYNSVLATACQGRRVELENLLNNSNKLDNRASTKVSNCFIKLNKQAVMENFNDHLDKYLNLKRHGLIQIAKKAMEVDSNFSSEQIISGETVGQLFDRLLQQDKEFMLNYYHLNNGDFELFYDDVLKKLLVE